MPDSQGIGVITHHQRLARTDRNNQRAAILRHDPRCRGIVLLGLSAPQDELLAGIAAAAPFPLVKGFAVGRTIFHDVASRWLRQEIDDEGAIEALTANLRVLADGWRAARDVRRVSGAAA